MYQLSYKMMTGDATRLEATRPAAIEAYVLLRKAGASDIVIDQDGEVVTIERLLREEALSTAQPRRWWRPFRPSGEN